MTEPPELAALARLSARIGGDIALVQAAGGNTSIKVDGVLWVKASGTWLADAESKPIFVAVPVDDTRHALGAGDEVIPVAAAGSTRRPSIETSLHALMPHAVVLHVHAVNSIAWAVRSDGRAELERRLGGLRWLWLPYCRPGLPLTQAIAAATAGHAPDVLILGNHGLVVGGADCAAAEALMLEVERRLAVPVRAAPAPDLPRLRAQCANTPYRPAEFPECHAVATDSLNLKVATRGSLYPDHVVFLGPGAPVWEAGEPVLDTIRRTAKDPSLAPPFFLIPGAGTVVRADLSSGGEPLLRCLGMVGSRLPADAAMSYLPSEEEQALLNWDAERYRKSMERTPHAPGR